MTKKKNFLKKSKKVSKNAEFHTDIESVEKVVKKCTIKSYKQNKFNEHGEKWKKCIFPSRFC